MQSIKCVVVGDDGVGKTCLLIRYTTKEFPVEYVPVVFDNYSPGVMVETKTPVLSFWDTAGRDEYSKLRPLSYSNANVVLICFAKNSKATLENVSQLWYPEIEHYLPKVVKVLVGTKLDLKDSSKSQDWIDEESGKAKSTEIGAKAYFECSAKENIGLNELFQFVQYTTHSLQIKPKCITMYQIENFGNN